MHLLLTQKGSISETNEAIDLNQTPAEMLFLSAADTELASVAAAKQRLGKLSPDLRIASLLALSHPMSIDTYIEKTAGKSRLIVVRVIGGENYWSYGLRCFQAIATQKNIKLVVLSGEDRPDEELFRFCTIAKEDCDALWNYLVQGGSDNISNFLKYCRWLLKGGDKPSAALPLLKAGLWSPEIEKPGLEDIVKNIDQPIAAICFYRALVQSGQTAPVERLIRNLERRGITPLPIFVSSLKDPLSIATIDAIFKKAKPDIVLNATGFAVSAAGEARKPTILEKHGNMVLQIVFSAVTRDSWQQSSRGLAARDLAMNVALPEIDGRVFTRAVSFKSASYYSEETQCNIVTHEPHEDRLSFVSELAKNWLKLKARKNSERKIALIMANYPGGDGRLGHGVGLDTPQSCVDVLRALKNVGYRVANLPASGTELIHLLALGPTNEGMGGRIIRVKMSVALYRNYFAKLPEKNREEILSRWGQAESDSYAVNGHFALPVMMFGETAVGIQPERAYGMDAKQVYHAPDIVPSHHYMAFYFWIRHIYQADAVIHMGKHGNLEWLPGKSLALSELCYPELALGPTPNIYPFIVNDPGEGTQAKRRSSAVIIDHLTPPLTRAESYGPLRDLEVLVDEYYEASGVDPRRLTKLKEEILHLSHITGLNHDAGIESKDHDELALQKLDAFLCDLKELQIRDGLHIFGSAPNGEQLDDLLVALARVSRGENEYDSLHRAIASDLHLTFDPLECDFAKKWEQERPKILADLIGDPWRSFGDAVERIELLAKAFISGKIICPKNMKKTLTILGNIENELKPLVQSCGDNELKGLFSALNGQFVDPGPSGAPTRGRPEVLPTGRNFYSLDNRAVPTLAAWDLGKRSAELLITRYVQDHGEWPTSLGLTAWGTSNMRTGGDDIAQAFALIGVRPVWDVGSRRVSGYEILSLAQLGRPRVDVTLRISGFFRDAFPEQMLLFDQAIRAVGALTQEAEDNPIARRMSEECACLINNGFDEDQAKLKSGFRIFGSRLGTYGTGVQELVDKNDWQTTDDLGRAWAANSSYAYGITDGVAADEALNLRLETIEAVVQNQDNREHDLLDSGEYYAFEGGMAAAVSRATKRWPTIYHNDFSRPERPLIKTLNEEIGRTLRGRAVNPKWIKSVMRHGYKGGVEMAATVDYLFAFAATTKAVTNCHFDLLYQAYIADDEVREFLEKKNPAALREIADKFLKAISRQLWSPRSNSAQIFLSHFIKETRHV